MACCGLKHMTVCQTLFFKSTAPGTEWLLTNTYLYASGSSWTPY